MRTPLERAVTWTMFLGAASGVVYLCLSMLRPFAGVIAWSVVLAIVCYPVNDWLSHRTGRIALSAFTTSVLMVFAFLIPLLVLGGVAAAQGVSFAHALRGAVQSPDRTLARTCAALASLTGRVGLDQHTLAAWIHQHRDDWMRSAGQHAMSFAAGLLEALASSFFVIVSLFLLLRDGKRIVAAITDLLPFDRQRSERLLQRIAEVVQASVYGVVVIALIHGAVYGTAFWILGVPSAALWGMTTVFASVVPVVGAFAVWGPVAVYLGLNGHWPQVVLVALTAALVSAIDHVLRPRLVAGRVGVSDLVMFFALLGGLAVFGPLGVVLGPVAFATFAAMVDTLRERSPEMASDAVNAERAA